MSNTEQKNDKLSIVTFSNFEDMPLRKLIQVFIYGFEKFLVQAKELCQQENSIIQAQFDGKIGTLLLKFSGY